MPGFAGALSDDENGFLFFAERLGLPVGRHKNVHPFAPLFRHAVLEGKTADTFYNDGVPEFDLKFPLQIPAQGNAAAPGISAGGGPPGQMVGSDGERADFQTGFGPRGPGQE